MTLPLSATTETHGTYQRACYLKKNDELVTPGIENPGACRTQALLFTCQPQNAAHRKLRHRVWRHDSK
jgi:hypothetical protein